MDAPAVVDLDLAISTRGGDYVVAATLTRVDSQTEAILAAEVNFPLDPSALLIHASDPSAYGTALTAQFFPVGGLLRSAWERATALADGANLPLRVRLQLPNAIDELSALRWETLHDPVSGVPLACNERLRLVRYLGSGDTRLVTLAARPELRALLVVASPDDLARYNLEELDVEGEAVRLRRALGDIPLAILGNHPDATSRATVAALQDALRDGPAILFLICHAKHGDDTMLWLEDVEGKTALIAGSALAELIAQLALPPLLAVLVACEGGGVSHHAGALAALGPRLAKGGIGAVVAMQDRVSLAAARIFLPALVTELARDGAIDRATAVARAALRGGDEWWIPALWLRLRVGVLWREPAPAQQGGGSSFTIAGPITAGVVNMGGVATFNQPVYIGLRSATPSPPAQASGRPQTDALIDLLAEALADLPEAQQADGAKALRTVQGLVAETAQPQPNGDLLAYYRRNLRALGILLAEAAPSAWALLESLERSLDGGE